MMLRNWENRTLSGSDRGHYHRAVPLMSDLDMGGREVRNCVGEPDNSGVFDPGRRPGLLDRLTGPFREFWDAFKVGLGVSFQVSREARERGTNWQTARKIGTRAGRRRAGGD